MFCAGIELAPPTNMKRKVRDVLKRIRADGRNVFVLVIAITDCGEGRKGCKGRVASSGPDWFWLGKEDARPKSGRPVRNQPLPVRSGFVEADPSQNAWDG